jgi:peptidoglycan/LPS O-acetylase OafA/YrhL
MSLGRLPPEAWLVTHALTILLVVAIAVGLHVAIERPSRELLRNWFDPLAPRRRAVVSEPVVTDRSVALAEAPPRPGLAE